MGALTLDCLVQAGFGERLAVLPEGAETFLYKNFDKEGVEISGGEAMKNCQPTGTENIMNCGRRRQDIIKKY